MHWALAWPYAPICLQRLCKLICCMTGCPAATIVCFDTAFHRDMPRVARIFPVPRRLQAQGVERYGFHGLSYAFLMEELTRVAGTEAAQGRVTLAHLGNGASLPAVRGSKSIDTSTGFAPAADVPMVFSAAGAAGARSGVLAQSGDFDSGYRRWLFFDVVGTKNIRHGHVVMKIDSVGWRPL